jgi:hypothetical protein
MTVLVGIGVGVPDGVGVSVAFGVGITLVEVGVTGEIGVLVGVAVGVGVQIRIGRCMIIGKDRQSFLEEVEPLCVCCDIVTEVLAKAGKVKIKLLSIKATTRIRQSFFE